MSYLQEAGDQKKYAKEAENLGFKLERSSGKHEIWKHESGAQVPAPKSGSDRRGFLNFRRDLKRALRNSQVELPTKPDKVKPEGLPTKVDKVIKTTRLSSAQRRQSNKTTRSGTPTTFAAFMDRLKPKPPSLQQRMSQGYSNTLRSLPLSVKVDMGNDIMRRMRYKPGQRYGISGIGLADEYMPESQLGGPLPRIKKPVEIQTITRSAKDGKNYPYREVLPKKGIYHNTPVIPITQPITNPDKPRTEVTPRPDGVKSKRKLKYLLPGGLEV